MSKKVLVVETSLRSGSNSDALAEAFAAGARQAGHQVTVLSLKGKTVGFCRGCLTCQQTGECAIRDDASAIARQMLTSDVLAFATPIYYYELSGQLKTLLDRMNPLFSLDYGFRDVYLLTSAADQGDDTPRRAVSALGGWIECFPRARLAGSVFAGGVNTPGAISGHRALAEAREMGGAV